MPKRKPEVQTRLMSEEDRARFALRRGTSKTQAAVHLGQARVREFRDVPASPKYVPKGRGKVEFD